MVDHVLGTFVCIYKHVEPCMARKSDSDSADPRPADANKCSNQFGRCKCKSQRLWAHGCRNRQALARYRKLSLYPVTMTLTFFFSKKSFSLLAVTTFFHRLLVFAFSFGYGFSVTPPLNSIIVAPAVRPEHISPFSPSTHVIGGRNGNNGACSCSFEEYRHAGSKKVLDTATCMALCFLV